MKRARVGADTSSPQASRLGGVPLQPLAGHREAASDDEKPGVRHHPMLRTDTPVGDVPESLHRFHGLDRREAAGVQRDDQLLHLRYRRDESDEYPAGPERVRRM